MKRIWLISHNFDGVMAGPSIRFQRYAPLFMEHGYRLCFVTRDLNQGLPPFEEKENFDIQRIKVKAKKFSRTIFISNSIKFILNNSESPPAIYTFSLKTYQLWLIPKIKSAGAKLFYINTMMEGNQFIANQSIFGKIWNSLHTKLYDILYRKIDGVIASTKTLIDAFEIFNLDKNKRTIINNGVDINRFSPPDEATKVTLREKYELPKNGLIILFVGLKTERKGLRELYDAWKKTHATNKNAYLLLVGDEKPGANSGAFQAWWKNLKNSEELSQMRIINRMGTRQIADFFKLSDAFVFPSKKEGMPNVVLEAMSCGLPLLMNRFEGYSDDYGEIGLTHLLFDHNDKDSFEEGLLVVLNNDKKREDIGEKGRAHAINYFSVDSSVKKYISLC